MYSKTSWKLLPLAAFVALAALVLVPGGSFSPAGVRAEVEDIECEDEGFDDGDVLDCTVTLTAENGAITIEVTDPGDATGIELDLDDCNEDCDDSDDEDDVIEVEDNGIEEINFSITADCADETDIDIEVSQVGGGSEEVTVTCGGSGGSASGNIVIINDEDSDDVDIDFEISGDASCDDDFTLSAGDEEGFDCDLNDTYTIQATLSTNESAEIDCEVDGEADVTVDEDEGEVVVELTDSDEDAVECTFTIESGGGSGSGTASSITASAGPNSVNCSGSSFITVVVKNAQGGNVPNGTAVQASTTLGSVNPTNATTQDGGVLILFTAPSNQGGTATITARSGSVQNTTSVTVNCAQAQPTQAPATPPPPPASGAGGIRPPATGDAGLADQSGTSYAWMAGLALIVSALVGGLAIARVRA
jgi:hypothetical protein